MDWLGYLVFYYIISFNLLRQSLALSLVFLAITFAFKDKNKTSLILIGISVLFHSSAIVAFFIYLITYFSKRFYSKKILIRIGMIFFVALMYFVANNISLLSSLKVIPAKYLFYESISNEGILSVNNLYRVPPYLLVLYVAIRKKDGVFNYQLFILLTIEILLIPLRLSNAYISRINYYFAYYRMSGYSSSIKFFCDQKMRIFLFFLLIIYYLIFFVVTFSQNPSYEYIFSHRTIYRSFINIFIMQ